MNFLKYALFCHFKGHQEVGSLKIKFLNGNAVEQTQTAWCRVCGMKRTVNIRRLKHGKTASKQQAGAEGSISDSVLNSIIDAWNHYGEQSNNVSNHPGVTNRIRKYGLNGRGKDVNNREDGSGN